jgi:hypothetical protein
MGGAPPLLRLVRKEVTQNPVFTALLRHSTTPKAALLPDWRPSSLKPENSPASRIRSVEQVFYSLRFSGFGM